jgi:two-component system sensor histidine kinase FlrB
MNTAITANPLPGDYEHLQHAFAIFSRASELLSGSYQELQEQVAQLTRELALANGELRRQLAEKEALSWRLGVLLAALPGGVVALDACGKVEEVNPAAVDMLGEPLLGSPWQALAEERLGGTNVAGEWELKQTRARRMRIESSHLDSAGGQILLIYDITEAHAMQERLRRNQRLAVMGEMAAGLAHQLRTPLSTALLYTAHLGNPALTDRERSGFAGKALERLRHLEYLIQDMLLFVKGGTAAWETVAIASVLSELKQVIEPQMSRRGLHFTVKDDSGGACLMADRKALCGALVSLLENAMQASSEGGQVMLDCNRTADAIVLTVTDNGPGIDAEIQERLFESFFTTRADGTGLGLSMVRGVAESAGGTVQVKSAPGAGSEFILRLPQTADTARQHVLQQETEIGSHAP